MTTKITMLLLSVIWAATAFAQGTVTLKGNIIGDTKGYNKLIIHFNNGSPEDSTFIGQNGKFQYTYPYQPNLSATIYTEYDIMVRQRLFPFVIVTKGKGKLKVRDADITKTLHSGKLSGNKTAVDYLTLQHQYMEHSNKTKDALTTIMTDLVGKFVSAHANSYAAIAAMQNYSVYLDNAKIESIHHALSQQQKQTVEAKDIAAHIAALKRSAVGNKVEDFHLPTPQAGGISFSSLKGKYVLIDFWASWCSPCKASFPHLKEMYAKYKSDKFEILGISIDRNKQDWLNELPKQELPWLQALDDQNLAKKTFAIIGVPTTYLIDPEGVILIKEIGFHEQGSIHQKLKELFGQEFDR